MFITVVERQYPIFIPRRDKCLDYCKMHKSSRIFSKITSLKVPAILTDTEGVHPPFNVEFKADGRIPFPQIIFYLRDREPFILNGDNVSLQSPGRWVTYSASLPAGVLGHGFIKIQVQGCRKTDIENALKDDWIEYDKPSFISIWLPAFCSAACKLSEQYKVFEK